MFDDNITAYLIYLERLEEVAHASPYSLAQKIIIAIVASVFSIVAVVGNSMVMISFKIDKQLQTYNNYFLFSLAVADFVEGFISIPFYTMFSILGYWPLGPQICDTWLALDYLTLNATVLNLLIISFDRYFSVSWPLTYRAKRTTRRAMVMIGSAWCFSLVLWLPWIYAWAYIGGERKVPPNECYLPFIETSPFIIYGIALAYFYVPATVMCVLYVRTWRETKKLQNDLLNLLGGKKYDSSQRSNSSDETKEVDGRARSESGDADSVYLVGAALQDARWKQQQVFIPSDPGYATPVAVKTPLQSTVSRCTSLKVIRTHQHIQDVSIPLNAMIIPKQLAGKGITMKQLKTKKIQEEKQETEAAKTLFAILLSFIITWMPCNVLVLLTYLEVCTWCSYELWTFFVFLCYIKSTINPICYALCNVNFRRTYVRILTCKWRN